MDMHPNFESSSQAPVRKLFTRGDLAIEYGLWGAKPDGKLALVAFHGFSRPLEDMEALLPYLQQLWMEQHIRKHTRILLTLVII